MLCRKWGTAVREGDEICHVCGTQISGNDASSRQIILQRENNKQYRLKHYPKKRNIRVLWTSIAGILFVESLNSNMTKY